MIRLTKKDAVLRPKIQFIVSPFYMKPCEVFDCLLFFFAVVDVFVVVPARSVPAGALASGPEQGRGQGPGGEAQEGRGQVSSSSRGGVGWAECLCESGSKPSLNLSPGQKERHDSRVLELSFCNVCQKKKNPTFIKSFEFERFFCSFLSREFPQGELTSSSSKTNSSSFLTPSGLSALERLASDRHLRANQRLFPEAGATGLSAR